VNALAKKKKIQQVIQTFFVVGVLFYLVQTGKLSFEAILEACKHWKLFMPAALLILIGHFIAIFRWQCLLQAHGIHLVWKVALRLSFLGNFFNTILPGAVTGDIVKVFHINRQLPGSYRKVLGSILLDRISGLSGLIFLSFGAFVWQGSLVPALHVFLVTSMIAACFFYACLLGIAPSRDPVFKWLELLRKKLPLTSVISETYQSIRHYHGYPKILWQALGLSVFLHLLGGLSFFLLRQSLGQSSITLASLYMVISMGLLVTSIPVAPAGVGTGNIAFFYLLSFFQDQSGAELYSLYAIIQILLAFSEGFIFLLLPSTPANKHHRAIEIPGTSEERDHQSTS